MPDIEEMNLQREIERYMKKYNEFDDYVFVSYSHKDWKVVYPVVLKWLQNGYNVHIDLSFKYNNENWVEQMQNNIISASCKLAVFFFSENYCYSYASMLEALTMFSEETTEARKIKGSDTIQLVQIVITNKTKAQFSSKEIEELYSNDIKELKKSMGEKLWKENNQEKVVFEQGLKALKSKNAELMEQQLEKSYNKGLFKDFYLIVANIILDWKQKYETGSNYLDIKKDTEIYDAFYARAEENGLKRKKIEVEQFKNTERQTSPVLQNSIIVNKNSVFSIRQKETKIRSKIEQVCMVVKKVSQMNNVGSYSEILQKAYSDVAEELKIEKSSVVDKCQRQLGLSAQQFAQMLFNQLYDNDDTLYNLIMSKTKNDSEKALVNETFNK